jgi:hypothetical protein
MCSAPCCGINFSKVLFAFRLITHLHHAMKLKSTKTYYFEYFQAVVLGKTGSRIRSTALSKQEFEWLVPQYRGRGRGLCEFLRPRKYASLLICLSEQYIFPLSCSRECHIFSRMLLQLYVQDAEHVACQGCKRKFMQNYESSPRFGVGCKRVNACSSKCMCCVFMRACVYVLVCMYMHRLCISGICMPVWLGGVASASAHDHPEPWLNFPYVALSSMMGS